MVLVPAFTSHLERTHEWPDLVRWNERLASFSRLIVFDKRSTGLSDHAPGPVVLEDTMEDVLAVLDATGAERAAVYGRPRGGAATANALRPPRSRITAPARAPQHWSRAGSPDPGQSVVG
jgi:pimeloyl-ACP methyl ester carboxylesterase